MKFKLLLFVSVILFACTNSKKEPVLFFSVEIENANGDSLFIHTGEDDEVAEFMLKQGILDKETLNLAMGYYRISDGNEVTPCFFKPEFDLHLRLNTKEFDESIQYTGKGAAENNYLAEKFLLEESFLHVNNYAYYAALEESAFLHFSDSIYHLKLSLFDKHKDQFCKEFKKLEFASLEREYLSKISDYESMHQYLTKDRTFKVSDSFPDAFKNIDVNDEELLLIPYYSGFIGDFVSKKARTQYKAADSISYFTVYLNTLDTVISNSKIKEKLAYDFVQYNFNYAKDKEYCYQKVKAMISKPEYLEEINDIYTRLKKIEKGAISPTFTLYDVDSNLVKLEDFKGKLVYIDIWSTWCGPCIKEIPHLLALEEEFKNEDIAFVSICEDNDRNRWKSIVKKNNLTGVHLFISEQNHPFIEAYLVTGVPRFILLDKEGRIIDANAKRPSNKAIKELLKEWLEK